MLKKRIIPCLDIQNGRTVKGVNFLGLRDAGDPVELAKKYAEEGADELVFLDITATIEQRETLASLVERIAAHIDIPFTVGGGIKSLKDAQRLIQAGADKVAINSSAVLRPELIRELSDNFGSQCVVVAIDTNIVNERWKVFIKGGREACDLECIDWAKQAVELGAGELLLTSMASDGTKNGFALEILGEICETVNVPVIASGGAGKVEHFAELFTKTKATGGLAASIFHYKEVAIPELKSYLKQQLIPIR